MRNYLSLCVLACSAAFFSSACNSASAQEQAAAPPPPSNPIKLQLPEAIYAVPGIEANIYFDNITMIPNPDAYIFDVTCSKGRHDAKRWRFLPKAEDVGEYKWRVTVQDINGFIAQAETKIIVTRQDAGKGREISILLVGDSLTNAGVYPARVFALMAGEDNPRVTMVGSNGPGYKPRPGGVAHEGWGGWAWNTFLTRPRPVVKDKPKPTDVPSPFLMFDEQGKGTLDLQNYFNTYCYGKAPDIVTFQLGVNDVFSANDDNLEDRINAILRSADTLVNAFREAAPAAIIGVGLVTAGASSQDSFGANYACGQTRWQYKKNQHQLNQAMMQWLSQKSDPLLSMIPTHVNLDCENNFPTTTEPVNVGNETQVVRQNNGVHPARPGYMQMGDTFYAWIKAQLAK